MSELEEIKILRKKFGLTQSALAKGAGVSQSLITKIESRKIDPTFSKMRKILDYLRGLHERHAVKAKDIMVKRIISIKPEAKIKDAIRKMKQYGISQMPVIENHKSIGLVSEAVLLDSLIGDNKHSQVEDVMTDAAPIVSKETTTEAIHGLLQYYPMILVAEQGKFCGVITKTDVIGRLARG
jgi:predicted transcriptional regulator